MGSGSSVGPEDWREQHPDLLSKVEHLLEQPTISDLKIIVKNTAGDHTFPVHRLVLALNSSVFDTMFYGCQPLKGDITISDVDVNAFRNLLRYFYTEKISIESVEDAINTYDAAEKYTVMPVKKNCTDYLTYELSPENSCKVYQFAHRIEHQVLLDKCLEIFTYFTEQVMSSESFKSSDRNTVTAIVEKESLCIPSEYYLLDAVGQWGKEQCSGQQNPDVRAVVEPLLCHIRFLFIQPNDLVSIHLKYGIVTREEMSSIFKIRMEPGSFTASLPDIFVMNHRKQELLLPELYTDEKINFPKIQTMFGNVKGRKVSFTIEVINGGLFLSSFSFRYKSKNNFLFTIELEINLNIPERLELQLFKNVDLLGINGVGTVYFPRDICLQAGESLGVVVKFNHTAHNMQCELAEYDKYWCFDSAINGSYLLRNTLGYNNMFVAYVSAKSWVKPKVQEVVPSM